MSAKKQSPWLALVSILIYFFLYAPIIVLIVFSFNASRTNVVFEGVVNQGPCGPFYWYCELFRNRSVMDATRNTLIIAFTSTVVSTIIGTMAALALQRYDFFGKKVSETTLYFPIVTPEIVMGIGILVFFSAVFGWINTALALAPSQRLTMGLGTVIVSHIAFSIPFVTLVVRARLHGFDDRLEEAAMDLGADEFTTFRKITLPLIAPGVLAGAMLAFTLSLDDFIITFFTTGPGATTLPIYVYGLLRRIVTPELNALSTIWVLVVLIVVAISQWFQRRE
ncbi:MULTISPECIES: ABC transporter permease [Caldilinea]|jgi:spermidine/putrescine transport system permease protein|uniref:Spermidine/putrescine ABC transporter permease protein n=1 Tax=Caldilinea aerophila (strain DSM 14535 / JCM 11387 / NBRC 104270 / STL-6-O1) TaxID=926550 RepID=I0I957_CALAS|nr:MULTISPECIES: ABC transporter permease [Caldilinea]MBO9391881.1 ABC transporter permease [Caldilinea sp.]BAM01795.1 spermidine/putrescine ABC transporter permease protein [Caldilinea aerophila DSM 14535 = NBRC 104270]GIV73129.1 MAG: ornithine carbamoyltransferase [Caldilinea sp.]